MAGVKNSTESKVIAAIPCFNVERSVAKVVLKAKEHVDQVVVINDGSYDGTAQAARTTMAVVIDHDTNRGYGAAIKSCFEAAEGSNYDILVTLDGDGQHNPDEIPRLLAPILQEEADLVIGSRFITSEHNMPKYRRVGIGVITFLWNFGSKVKVSDAQSGFRAYGKKMFKNSCLFEKGMSVSIEILEEARSRGIAIKEVPISCLYYHSTMNFGSIKHGLSVALSVVRIRLKNFLSRTKSVDNIEERR